MTAADSTGRPNSRDASGVSQGSAAQAVVMPGDDLPMQQPAVMIDLFNQAAKANRQDACRRGATAWLPDHGDLVMTGDLHDHGLNFQRIVTLADLDRHPDRHLILHEVIHGPHPVQGRDLSIRTLARVAALKVAYPHRVHLLQSNHELAQLRREGILKDGHSVVEAFDQGVDMIYGQQADAVRQAMNGFLRSLLVAVKCPNGIFCSHSLPAARLMGTFDTTVLDRVPTDEDLAGPVYQMVWGRNHTQALADWLAQAWDTRLFVMGHQPAEMGYHQQGDTMLVLASDHSHGMALVVDLAAAYTMPQLLGRLVPLNSVPTAWGV